ncbi:hypothetical protein BV898_01796 [Hypsibius exemplaris]|uniref:DUF19 domain-containing protein n=1 Tax=Hypsibius exemplaris TaxID=2072580 RepID=A0A1W0X9Q1_HYPEX|nr:hypothetical protein BV898_01796 [Hypsibius exemplaris]
MWLAKAVSGRCLAEHCHQNELQQCMEHVKPIMQNVTIGFAANAEQLNTVCKLFKEGMTCIDKFVIRCFQESQRILFRENMAGVKEVMTKLCEDGEYRKEYLTHADCFRSVAPQYEECGGVFRTSVGTINQNRADTADKLSQMCSALHRFLECAYGLTSQHCGDKGRTASEFLRSYTEKAVGSLITSTCRKFPTDQSSRYHAGGNGRVTEIEEAVGLREVNIQEYPTSVFYPTSTRPPRSSRRGGGGKKEGRRSKSTLAGGQATTPMSRSKSSDPDAARSSSGGPSSAQSTEPKKSAAVRRTNLPSVWAAFVLPLLLVIIPNFRNRSG